MHTLLFEPESALYRQMQTLVRQKRMIFVAGLPGTGKSLLIHQLSHIANATQRSVWLLQWDTCRPPFEACVAGKRYPQDRGATHPMIRVAVGLWVRQALAYWHAQLDERAILIGETPFVGNRFTELAERRTDDIEPMLAGAQCQFLLSVPSVKLRAHMEAERERRAAHPMHEREKEDAPPNVLRDLWHQLAAAAGHLGMPNAPAQPNSAPYDPHIYEAVFMRLLKNRQVQVWHMDEILPAQTFSAYDYKIAISHVLPTPDEANQAIGLTEQVYSDSILLQNKITHWYE
jgi:hypothetical protein